MITYQEIYDMLRKEKYNEALADLPKRFLKDLSAYISEKRKILTRESSSNLFSDTIRMTRKQLDNTLSVIKELLAIRERKVLNLAFAAAQTGVSKRDTENLFNHEKELFDLAVKKLEDNQKLVKEQLEGNFEEEKDLKNLFIRFNQDVPAFLGPNGKELGPFKVGEIANLPKEIVEILKSDNKVEIIDA